MESFKPFHTLLLTIQGLAAFVGCIYLFKLKKTYWKWFAAYLILIFAQEIYWSIHGFLGNISKRDYFALLGIPIQYIFLFWLYAYKSLKKKKLFFLCLATYLLTYIPVEYFLKEKDIVYSINLTVGTVLLTFLVILEFIKQIKNENILLFKSNKMFYVNVGVILCYIGTYPFFAFQKHLSSVAYETIWVAYYTYFLISNCFLYLLYTASLLWGKHPLN